MPGHDQQLSFPTQPSNRYFRQGQLQPVPQHFRLKYSPTRDIKRLAYALGDNDTTRSIHGNYSLHAQMMEYTMANGKENGIRSCQPQGDLLVPERGPGACGRDFLSRHGTVMSIPSNFLTVRASSARAPIDRDTQMASATAWPGWFDWCRHKTRPFGIGSG